MKKLLTVLFLSVLISVVSISVVHALSAVPGPISLDATASYVPNVSNKFWSTDDYRTICQKFKVSKAGIAKYADITGYGTSTNQITLELNEATGESGNTIGALLQVFYPPASFNDGQHQVMTRFTSGQTTAVTPDNFYWLCMHADSGGKAAWYSDSAEGCPSCIGKYPNGFAKLGGDLLFDTDLGFKIYSFDWVLPDPEVNPPDPIVPDPVVPNPTPAADAPLPTGVTAGTNAAPAATTTTIKAPTSLTATDTPNDQGGSLLLTWVVSATTDIDGYKVFRSTTEITKDFKEIARTEKTILTFTDNTAAIGQKYYYMVRAYKNTQESVSSNVANGISVDNLAPATPVNFVYVKDTETSQTFSWDSNTDADLLAYTLLITAKDEPTTVIKAISIPKGINTYTLDYSKLTDLDLETEYDFYLVATDTNTNESEKATVKGVDAIALAREVEDLSTLQTLWNNIKPIILYIAGGFVLLVIAIVGGLLYFLKGKKGKIVPKGTAPVATPEVKAEDPVVKPGDTV